MAEPRTRTLSFRLTESERRRIDIRAEAAGLEPSEYARRALLDVVTVSERERARVREAGRAELREELARTQAALIEWRDLAGVLQRRADAFEAKLKAAPAELVAAIDQLIAGAPDARARVADLWARIHATYGREELLPQLAALVGDGIEVLVGRFPADPEARSWWPNCRRRIEWLMDALRPDVGHEVHRASWNSERIWKHVLDALEWADAERRRYGSDHAEQ
ncbi:MAG: plasmid mobilization protein [Candidatus Dormibacteria bacterium]